MADGSLDAGGGAVSSGRARERESFAANRFRSFHRTFARRGWTDSRFGNVLVEEDQEAQRRSQARRNGGGADSGDQCRGTPDFAGVEASVGRSLGRGLEEEYSRHSGRRP